MEVSPERSQISAIAFEQKRTAEPLTARDDLARDHSLTQAILEKETEA